MAIWDFTSCHTALALPDVNDIFALNNRRKPDFFAYFLSMTQRGQANKMDFAQYFRTRKFRPFFYIT